MIHATHLNILVEFKSVKEMRDHNFKILKEQGRQAPNYVRRDREFAHNWVRKGYSHMTGLWMDGSKIRYARAEA